MGPPSLVLWPSFCAGLFSRAALTTGTTEVGRRVTLALAREASPSHLGCQGPYGFSPKCASLLCCPGQRRGGGGVPVSLPPSPTHTPGHFPCWRKSFSVRGEGTGGGDGVRDPCRSSLPGPRRLGLLFTTTPLSKLGKTERSD